MAKKNGDKFVELVRPEAGAVTISVLLNFGDDDWGCPDEWLHTLKTSIPDPQGTKNQSGRMLSAGFVFGMDLARVANRFRDALANPEEIAAGFAREMQDWDKDHGKGGK